MRLGSLRSRSGAVALVRGLLLGALLAPARNVRADTEPNPSFYLVNRSGVAITRVFASPADRPNWGSDQLESELTAGANAPIRLPADGRCVYDIRVVYATGRSEERRGLNLCRVDNLSFPGATAVVAGSTSKTGDPTFVLSNRSRSALTELYLSATGEDSWGADRLRAGSVRSGGATTIRLPRGHCVFDLRAVFANGEANEKRNLNLCETTDLRVP